jgi:hypothetical protein
MFEDILGTVGGFFLGIWGIIAWIIQAWFGLINIGLGFIGWLLIIISMYFLLTSQTLIGSIIFAVALFFLFIRELFKLASFWLSEEKYVISPQAFVGNIIGNIIGFVFLFAMLFGLWYFVFPVPWLFVISVALIPIVVMNSFFQAAKNFFAMIKSNLTGKVKK